jgi:hypothetical protein
MANKDFGQEHSDLRFQETTQKMWEIAQDHQNNSLELLAILRSIEHLHKQIRDDLFQKSLPDNRQSLYKLLKDIESRGGWPYIYRMKLKDLMERLDEGATVNSQSSILPDSHTLPDSHPSPPVER